MNLNFINDTIQAILPYKGYIAVATAWLAHVYIPHLIRIYPYVTENGGVLGIVKAFLVGKSVKPVVPPTQPPQ